MSIGKISEFNVHKDDWELYVERLEQYFVVNDIKKDLHVPTLITVMGAESYELLVNLCTPNKPKTKTFEQLSEIMGKHLQPKPSELAERYKFRHRKQKEGETISEYVAVLKKMSKTCEFGSWLEESLRDQLVCGIASENIRQRLFAESKLDFAKAYKLAASMESAEKDAAIVEGPKSSAGTDTSTVTCQAMTTARHTAGGAERGGQPGVVRRGMRERRDFRERRAGHESVWRFRVSGLGRGSELGRSGRVGCVALTTTNRLASSQVMCVGCATSKDTCDVCVPIWWDSIR